MDEPFYHVLEMEPHPHPQNAIPAPAHPPRVSTAGSLDCLIDAASSPKCKTPVDLVLTSNGLMTSGGSPLRSSDPAIGSPTEGTSPLANKLLEDSNNNKNSKGDASRSSSSNMAHNNSRSTSSVYYAQIIYDEYEKMKKDSPGGSSHNRVPLIINPVSRKSTKHNSTSSSNDFTKVDSPESSGLSNESGDAAFMTLPAKPSSTLTYRHSNEFSTLSRPALPPPPPPPTLPPPGTLPSQKKDKTELLVTKESPRRARSFNKERPLPEVPNKTQRYSPQLSNSGRSLTPESRRRRQSADELSNPAFKTLPNRKLLANSLSPVSNSTSVSSKMSEEIQLNGDEPGAKSETATAGTLKKINMSLKKFLKRDKTPTRVQSKPSNAGGGGSRSSAPSPKHTHRSNMPLAVFNERAINLTAHNSTATLPAKNSFQQFSPPLSSAGHRYSRSMAQAGTHENQGSTFNPLSSSEMEIEHREEHVKERGGCGSKQLCTSSGGASSNKAPTSSKHLRATSSLSNVLSPQTSSFEDTPILDNENKLRPPKRPVRIFSFRGSPTTTSAPRLPCVEPSADYVNKSSFLSPDSFNKCNKLLQDVNEIHSNVFESFLKRSQDILSSIKSESVPLLNFCCIHQPNSKLCASLIFDLLLSYMQLASKTQCESPQPVKLTIDQIRISVPTLVSPIGANIFTRPRLSISEPLPQSQNFLKPCDYTLREIIAAVIYSSHFLSLSSEIEEVFLHVTSSPIIAQELQLLVRKDLFTTWPSETLLACVASYLWGPFDSSITRTSLGSNESLGSRECSQFNVDAWLLRQSTSLLSEISEKLLMCCAPFGSSPTLQQQWDELFDRANFFSCIISDHIVSAISINESMKYNL